eukprot:280617_1
MSAEPTPEPTPNQRDIPIDASIPPREWGARIYRKNKDALVQTCINNNVEHESTATCSELVDLLKIVRETDYKKHVNQVARDKYAQKTKAKKINKNKRKKSRKQTDSIRKRPTMLNVNSFEMEFNPTDSVVRVQSRKPIQSNAFVDLSGDNNDKNEDLSDVKKDEKNGDIKDLSGDNNGDNDNIKDNNKQDDVIVKETVEEALRRIGLSEDQIDIFVGENYETIGDALAETENDLAGMGFRRGAVRAISRKFSEEKKRLGIETNVVGDIQNGSDIIKLLAVLAANKNDANDNKNDSNNDKPKVKNLWDKTKVGGRPRHCFIGPVAPESIQKYNRKIMNETLMSNVTDASELRSICWKKTRTGVMNEVRCKYDETKETWPHANMQACKDAIIYLDMHRYVVIFEQEERAQDQYYCRFGRNIISTALALQETVDDAKREYKFMKETSGDVQWKKYAKETYDEPAERFRLCDFAGDGPDWEAFGKWIESNPDLRHAQDPTESS